MKTKPTRKTPEKYLHRWWMVFLFGSLTLITAYRIYHRPSYELEVFATQRGWGYTVLRNQKPYIYQPTIPGQSGARGFTDEKQARRVGQAVIQKIRDGQAPPSLSDHDLRQLGVEGN